MELDAANLQRNGRQFLTVAGYTKGRTKRIQHDQREAPVSVFINYRAEDSLTTAALIDHALTAKFGRDNVFLDCRSIPAGADFVDEVSRRLEMSTVLLVIIGPRWLTVNEVGGRWIDDPRDWIRSEIELAFTKRIRVIPVLIDQAPFPREEDLPEGIAELSRRQYVPLRPRYTEVDLNYLVECITEADPQL
jgi:TIR domain